MEMREPPTAKCRPIGRRHSLLCRLRFHSWERVPLEETAQEWELPSEILAGIRKSREAYQNRFVCRQCSRCGLEQEHHLTFDVRGDIFCKRCHSCPDGYRTPGIRF